MSSTIREHNLKAAAMWSSGGRAYNDISRICANGIDHCVTRLNPAPGERVIDIATGTGWTSREVARRGASVVGVDIADGLLVAARDIAREQNLTIDYQIGDAEALPFADGEFDAVISTFGVMFAPDQQRAAAELARVCRRGGRAAIAAWTPNSHAVTLRQVMAPFMTPPPAPPPSPFVWGTREWLNSTFGRDFRLGFEEGTVLSRLPSMDAAWNTRGRHLSSYRHTWPNVHFLAAPRRPGATAVGAEQNSTWRSIYVRFPSPYAVVVGADE